MITISVPAGKWLISAGVSTANTGPGVNPISCSLTPAGYTSIVRLNAGETGRVTIQQPMTLASTTQVGLTCTDGLGMAKAYDYTLNALELSSIG